MKLSKTKKIILSLVTIGVLTIFIVTPILVVKNNEKDKEDIKPNIHKLKINLPSTATLKGLNINNVEGRTIFQDSFKNLWSMGQNSKLEVLKVNSSNNGYVNEGWINENDKTTGDSLLKNSNITNGLGGKIFQDSFGNLWTMGLKSKLQVLKVNPQKNGYVNEGWKSDNLGLTKNSNITDGYVGKIFQDSFKNLWAMGQNKKLQVLKKDPNKDGYVNEGWTSSNSNLTKNSNITNGYSGKIFQDSFKNLWAMGSGSKLQVLKKDPNKDGYVNEGWTSSNSNLTKKSNITDGSNGTIFQDSFKNLWAMGSGSKLQVLEVNSQKKGYVNEGWKGDNSYLTKNSNITNFAFGKFFQDSFKNLWSMGRNSKLQFLKVNLQKNGYVNEGWKSDNLGLTKNSNIINGVDGAIFQDSFGNLWTMGNKTKLQVLKVNEHENGYVNEGWKSDNSGLTKNSNITDGIGGTIFQDKFKNLWTMGNKTKLQVLKANKNKDVYVYLDSWINK